MATESIKVSAVIPASADRIYAAWLDSDGHAQMTGGPAKIEPTVGGEHSAWGDYISGKNEELEEGRRIVQTWRAQDFPAEAGHSRLVVTFEPEGDHTRVTVEHSEIPEGMGAGFMAGWDKHYFGPMTAFFGGPATPEPAKKPAARKPAARKPAAKKPAAKKAAAKKAAKKATAKKPAAKKAAAKKSAAKKPAAKKSAKKKPAAKKAAKKATAKKPAARKKAAKKSAKKAAKKKG